MGRLELRGEVIAPGIVTGTLCFINSGSNSIALQDEKHSLNVSREIARFEKEAGTAAGELREVVEILKEKSLFDEIDIVQAGIITLKDKEFHREVHEWIKTNRLAVEIAIEHVLAEMMDTLERSAGLEFYQRAAKARDILQQLKMKLLEEIHSVLNDVLKQVSNPVIVLKELLPTFMLEAKDAGVKAVIVEKGTSLSHAAILAKSFGISVLKLENLARLKIKNHTEILVDAINGRLVVGPYREETGKLKRPAFRGGEKEKLPVKVWLNIVDSNQLDKKDLQAVEGIGLYRTEFLFMKSKINFPTEEEQYYIYSSLFEKCEDHPITIRTLDIGGDKILPYFSVGPQDNPYLGLRGHRIYRFHPEIFVNQVRAIVKAGLKARHLRILYPMIETVDELLFVQKLLGEAIDALKREGTKYNDNFQQGIMVEVPSAVWNFQNLLNYVDFASIGTNDLLQYFFAVDRNNANVQRAYRPENPGALSMLKTLVDTARNSGKQLSVCGEIASDKNVLPLLVGLGFQHISVDFYALPGVIECLSDLDVLTCQKLIQDCLASKSSEEVRTILAKSNSLGREAAASQGKDDQEHIDPICQMVVNTDGNELVIAHGKRKYYFCSKYCRDRFIKEQREQDV